MDDKEKKAVEREPVKKWQVTLQWIVAGVWLVTAVLDLIFSQKAFLTSCHCVAAACFLFIAISLTKRYREDRQDG